MDEVYIYEKAKIAETTVLGTVFEFDYCATYCTIMFVTSEVSAATVAN